METRQMTQIFLSTFFALTVCNIDFFYLKIVKIYFDVVLLWSILICKIPQFWAQTTNSTMHHPFPEHRHPEVTKNPLCLVPRVESKKGISSWASRSLCSFL